MFKTSMGSWSIDLASLPYLWSSGVRNVTITDVHSSFPLGFFFSQIVFIWTILFFIYQSTVLGYLQCFQNQMFLFLFLIFNTWCNRSCKDVPLIYETEFCIPINSSLKTKFQLFLFFAGVIPRSCHWATSWPKSFLSISDCHLSEWEGLRKHARKWPF